MPSRRRSGVTKRNLSHALFGRRPSITKVAAATGRSSRRAGGGRTRRCFGANRTSACNSDTGIGRSPGITSFQNPARRPANCGHSELSASGSQARSTIGKSLPAPVEVSGVVEGLARFLSLGLRSLLTHQLSRSGTSVLASPRTHSLPPPRRRSGGRRRPRKRTRPDIRAAGGRQAGPDPQYRSVQMRHVISHRAPSSSDEAKFVPNLNRPKLGPRKFLPADEGPTSVLIEAARSIVVHEDP